MLRRIPARPEQTLRNTLTKIHASDRVRSVHACRTGTAIKIYVDGSAAVCWDDGEPQPEGLAHERMPRTLLELLDQASPDHAEQTASVLQIVAAALAPTLSDALDIAGTALNNIASIARSDQPSARPTMLENSIEVACCTVNETLHTLDRVTCILEAIKRLADDSDDAIVELACVASSIVEAETERVDTVFTHLGHCMLNAEVNHV